MSELAAVLTRSMQASAGDLMVLDRETSLWCRHPWPEVHGLAESVAAWLLDHDRPAAVGLVGEPTVELVAAIQGAWLAGAAVSILPGPVRGANDQRWADATLTRFLGIGVRTVLSQGSYLARLRSVDTAGVTIGDLSTAAHTNRSATPVASEGPRSFKVPRDRRARPVPPSFRRARCSATCVGSISAWAPMLRPTSVAHGYRCTTTWGSLSCSLLRWPVRRSGWPRRRRSRRRRSVS